MHSNAQWHSKKLCLGGRPERVKSLRALSGVGCPLPSRLGGLESIVRSGARTKASVANAILHILNHRTLSMLLVKRKIIFS